MKTVENAIMGSIDSTGWRHTIVVVLLFGVVSVGLVVCWRVLVGL
jgi:nitrogen fixation protein FixH